MTLSRRSFLASMLAAAAAPQFVRRESLGGLWMPSWRDESLKFNVQIDGLTASIQMIDTEGRVISMKSVALRPIRMEWDPGYRLDLSHYKVATDLGRFLGETNQPRLFIQDH